MTNTKDADDCQAGGLGMTVDVAIERYAVPRDGAAQPALAKMFAITAMGNLRGTDPWGGDYEANIDILAQMFASASESGAKQERERCCTIARAWGAEQAANAIAARGK